MLPSPQDEIEFQTWLDSEPRPPIVRVNAKRFPPWKRYAIRLNDGRAAICSGYVLAYGEDGTLRVSVESPVFPREVFGVKPEDLVEVVEDNQSEGTP